MADTIIKAGDFTGFSFNGVHSSRLGIIRVSDGDRYNETLHPEIEDKSTPIVGGDGSYYFGSDYRSKNFSISIAFDSMTEKQFRRLVQLFSTKDICDLIFDERPYKVYSVKLAQPIDLNYICFDEPIKTVQPEQDGIRTINRNNAGEGTREKITPYKKWEQKQRIYKGEGTIELICTYPFARQQFKILERYGQFDTLYDAFGTQTSYNNTVALGNPLTIYTNINEWVDASGILPYNTYNAKNIDKIIASSSVGYNYCIPVYNPGDRPAPYYLYLPYTKPTGESNQVKGKLNPYSDYTYIRVNTYNDIMLINPFSSNTVYSKENGVIINTRNHLIEGVLFDSTTDSWVTTGNVYNWNIVAGDFGQIYNLNWGLDSVDITQAIYLNCATAGSARIFYNYIYY